MVPSLAPGVGDARSARPIQASEPLSRSFTCRKSRHRAAGMFVAMHTWNVHAFEFGSVCAKGCPCGSYPRWSAGDVAAAPLLVGQHPLILGNLGDGTAANPLRLPC